MAQKFLLTTLLAVNNKGNSLLSDKRVHFVEKNETVHMVADIDTFWGINHDKEQPIPRQQ
jgi:hypothetical protein